MACACFLSTSTHGHGAEADAANSMKILLRPVPVLDVLYDKKRTGDVDDMIVVQHLKVGHARAVVAERLAARQ